jgi:hypothetical protein
LIWIAITHSAITPPSKQNGNHHRVAAKKVSKVERRRSAT